MSEATMAIANDFKRQICSELEVVPDGNDRFCVTTPLTYDDGDALPIILRREGEGWLLTDEGESLMHLSYTVDERDLMRGPRQEIIRRALSTFEVQNRGGELVLPIRDGRYGDALYAFIHMLLKIDDVRFLSRDRAVSTFFAEFQNFVESRVALDRQQWKWNDPSRDPSALYPVDVRINGRPRPLYIFALSSTDKVNAAIIALLLYKSWGVGGDSVGIYENEDNVPRKIVRKFSDTGARAFGNLVSAQDQIGLEFPDVFAATGP